ncbi:MAG: hypothetical protein OXC11_16595 [Rhodospirillales bacterium]|nr:hypothetical protein [Rhodospirillales bacterium]
MTPEPTTNGNSLPDTLADLLEVACDDMAGLDREYYLPNSLLWHNPIRILDADRKEHRSRCEVCLAGAVMAGSLAMDRDTGNTAADSLTRFGMEGHKLRALDALRNGNVRGAAHVMQWHPDSIAHAMAFEQREDAMELLTDIRAIASFYTWEHWDNSEPRYRRLIDLLRTHGL